MQFLGYSGLKTIITVMPIFNTFIVEKCERKSLWNETYCNSKHDFILTAAGLGWAKRAFMGLVDLSGAILGPEGHGLLVCRLCEKWS